MPEDVSKIYHQWYTHLLITGREIQAHNLLIMSLTPCQLMPRPAQVDSEWGACFTTHLNFSKFVKVWLHNISIFSRIDKRTFWDPLKPQCWEPPGHYLCTHELGRLGCVISIQKGVNITSLEKRLPVVRKRSFPLPGFKIVNFLDLPPLASEMHNLSYDVESHEVHVIVEYGDSRMTSSSRSEDISLGRHALT